MNAMTPEELKRLDELEKAATPAPWGWKQTGDKSNDAVLATFYDNENKPIGGRVECERYNEQTGEYETIATDDEVIFYRENDANYSDFALTCELRNMIRPLLAHIATLEGFKREALAARALVCELGLPESSSGSERDVYRIARAANTQEKKENP